MWEAAKGSSKMKVKWAFPSFISAKFSKNTSHFTESSKRNHFRWKGIHEFTKMTMGVAFSGERVSFQSILDVAKEALWDKLEYSSSFLFLFLLPIVVNFPPKVPLVSSKCNSGINTEAVSAFRTLEYIIKENGRYVDKSCEKYFS